MTEPGVPPGEPAAGSAAARRGWTYLGVGCLTALVGLVGGGMIGVLVAKIAGGVTGCAADPETGAPCMWDRYWTWGAWIGLVVLPLMALWRLRQSGAHPTNTEQG